MRQMIFKLAAAIAVVTAASAAPAMACGNGLFSGGCSPCAQAYASPCSQGYGQSYGYGAGYQQLPDPAHQYYYVNQGPTFSGPGNFAPTQYYQETSTPAVGYERDDSAYDGGPYANPVNHASYARPYRHAAVQYSYQPRVRHYGYGYNQRSYAPRYSHRSYAPRYTQRSYAPRYAYHHRRFAGPRVMYAPRYASPRYHHYQRPLRRMY
ncbi:hypothetical protein BH11PSE4_BH11PSE4_09390 [soil metagenome]